MGNCQDNRNKEIIYAMSTNNQDKAANETHVYRHPGSIGKDLNTLSPVHTLHEVYNSRLKTEPNEPSIGRREKDANGQLANTISWYTNQFIREEAEAIGSGILNLGLAAPINEWRNMSLTFGGIYAKNSLEYILYDIALCMYGITVVPIYDTLGEEATIFAFNQTKMSLCAITANHVEKMLKQQKDNNLFPYLKSLIVFDPENLPQSLKGVTESAGIKLWSLTQIKDAGRSNVRAWATVSPDSVYAFSYTSGTTGEPKGAMITHGNITGVFSGAIDRLQGSKGDRYVSYLPMAHVMERVAFNYFFWANVKILVFSGDVMKLKEDLAVFKPTIFFSVPRLYNKFYDVIQTGIKEKGGIARKLIDRAIRVKTENLENECSYTHSIYDKLVFKKMKAALGGEVVSMLTGSAPINEQTLKFLKIAFCAPIIEGYGQTEATALEFTTFIYDPKGGHVGGPALHNEFKLVDVPEMNYRSTDVDELGNPQPRGEIWIRGPNVIPGYYKMDDKNLETFTSDGWMLSGDVAMLMGKEKRLKIIDRKKNIFKLSQGEYIAPEKLENIYKLAHPLISAIYVYGDSLKSCVVAVVNVEATNINALAKELGVPENTPENLSKSPELKKKIIELFDAKAKESKLNPLEKIKAIHIETTSFADLKLLTEAFKVKRVDTKDYYKAVFDELYSHPQ